MGPNRAEAAFPFELGRFSRLDKPLKSGREEASQSGGDEYSVFEKYEAPALATAPVEPPTRAWRISFPNYVSGPNPRFVAAIIAAGAIAYYARGRTVSSVPPPASTIAPSRSPVAVVNAAGPMVNGGDYNAADSLGLRAEYQGNSLFLEWDRTSDRVTNAMSGVVIIADGSHTRVLTLSPHELRNGGIVYSPRADEINVELEVIASRGISASQSIRILAASALSSASAPVSAAAARIVSRVLPPPPVASSEMRTVKAARFQSPPPSSAELKPKSIAIPDAPVMNEVQVARAAASEPALAMLPASPLMAALPPAPVLRVEPDPLTPVPSGDRTFANSAAPARRFHAPTPIHAPQPRIPQNLGLPQYAFENPLAVKVHVSINTEGRVARAQVMDTVGAYASRLVPSALNTAREWRFRPAMLGDEPVESTLELTFQYSHPQR